MAPAATFDQAGCLPPEEPFAYEPPTDDPEPRALIDGQYQDYIRDTESYLDCLNDKSSRARGAFRTRRFIMSSAIGGLSGQGWYYEPDPTGTSPMTASARTHSTPVDTIED